MIGTSPRMGALGEGIPSGGAGEASGGLKLGGSPGTGSDTLKPPVFTAWMQPLAALGQGRISNSIG